ncbi:alkaline phosphatase [Cupriavidus sp. AU9028]|uniref:alkaline phosphatase D family protein n=1 Tax=Cupriavidus sp. AU9028 TaxID=2871157 RepID=UPI001C970A5B|nr:alkaline phosphatase D family protein [Cupriavidus sp. AU9028]MBY4897950.1 alkaline phosphatase D family protein [Cupriavidus sp. AU9028]
MDRRLFLKLGGFITVSAATGTLTACGDDGSPAPAPTEPGVPPATGANWKFPQSIASGDPRPDGIMLWTRVVPASVDDAAAASADASFAVRLRVTAADNAQALGSNAALNGDAVVDASIPVSGAYDCTVRHKITGLDAGRTYYYQFTAGEVRSRVGRFRTAPAPEADVAQLRLGFLSCQDWSINHWGTFEALAAEDLDLIVHLGDYVYETVGEDFQLGAVEASHGPLVLPDGTYKSGNSGARYATTLNDYRYLYKRYRTDPRLQAVHERFAIVATWDDHEFSDDCWGDAETYNGQGDGVENRQPARRRAASRAWFEFMPADIAFDEAQQDIFGIRIYRELRFGKLAHLVMTDERLYRTDHVIPESTVNPATGAALGSIGARYMVPSATLAAAEAAKMAAAGATDPLALTSILGATQRDWWRDTMARSPAIWKLWGNEVSLLRMGIDGANAIATLVALQAVATLASSIQGTLPATGNDAPLAAAVVGAMTAGASQAAAVPAAQAIALADAGGGDKTAAALAAGLTAAQAGIAVLAFEQARGAAPAGIAAQVGAAAQAVAFGFVRPDVLAQRENSAFIPAGQKAALAAFFQHFVINADQWDGFHAERRALMQHLADNGIRNVVALTGDIHAFYAGTVHDDYDAAGGGTPVMVDLVTAGISSDSFFSYLKSAVGGLSESLATLVYRTLDIPVPALGAEPLQVDLNLLNHTLASSAVTAASVAASLRVAVRGKLAARGIAEGELDSATGMVLGALQADATFRQHVVPLCQQLAGLNSNPWLQYANTDAQGYAVVTVTPDALRCEFRHANRLVGTAAPQAVVAHTVQATVRRDIVAVEVAR